VPKMPIPKLPKPLLAACLALPLTASTCGDEVVSTPPAERFAPVALPTVPPGEAQCDDGGDGAPEPCLSDRQTGGVINSLIDALETANGKLLWLRDYFQPQN
jgi:hypothetical protein